MTQRTWLTPEQLAERLNGVPVETLEYWRTKRKGPRFAKFGRHVRYELGDIQAWEDAQFGEAS